VSSEPKPVPSAPADERIFYGDDDTHFFDLYAAKGKARGVVMMVHGGFWRAKYDLAHAGPFCAALAREGFTTANLEYRRVGNGGGWAMSFDDVRHGLVAVAERLKASPVVVGHSAGGHLALRLAEDPANLRAVVALAPVADLCLAYDLHLSNDAVVEFIGGTPEDKPHAYAAADPAHHPSAVHRILIHGMSDDTVPVDLSRAYVRARDDDEGSVELIELPNASHLDVIDPESTAWIVVLDAVGRLS
jgi:acetyl esterase/lipase